MNRPKNLRYSFHYFDIMLVILNLFINLFFSAIRFKIYVRDKQNRYGPRKTVPKHLKLLFIKIPSVIGDLRMC